MYWDGTQAFALSDTTSAGGDITAVNTNAGSGLAGGATSGDATLSVVTDGATLEVNGSNQLQVRNAGITATQIATDAVVNAKIQDGAVTNAKLATDAVTEVKIEDGAVTNAKIVSVGVENHKLGDELLYL